MKLLEAIRRRGRRIASEIEESKLFEQMVDRGRFREAVIQDLEAMSASRSRAIERSTCGMP
jgi:hypothetical protein